MRKSTGLFGIFAAVLLALAWVAPAQAQATRTWISGVGDDANPCSRTAPCKTFAGAISKTATGGEIDCLDPGGFGAVTITKSITFDCGGGIGGQVGSILVAGTNGININAANVIVKIRNMTINGIQASGNPGLSGIKFSQGSALIVEHVGIFGFGGTGGNNGGVDFEPSTAAKLAMLDVEVQYGLADGILIKPASGGSAKATLVRVSGMVNNGAGLRVDSTNVTSGLGSNVAVFDCNFTGNANGVSTVSPPGTVSASVEMTNSVVSQNTSTGAVANGANAFISIGGSSFSNNPTGILSLNSGLIKSFGDNYFVNGTNGTPTAPNFTKL